MPIILALVPRGARGPGVRTFNVQRSIFQVGCSQQLGGLYHSLVAVFEASDTPPIDIGLAVPQGEPQDPGPPTIRVEDQFIMQY
jgi:hypothetical protein